MRLLLGASIVVSAALAVVDCREPPTHQDSAPPSYILVTPTEAALTAIGQTLQLAAEAHDSTGDGRDVLRRGEAFTWTTDDSAIARVSASGLVTAVAWGEAVVKASAHGVWGGAIVSVQDRAAVSYVVVTPISPTLTALGQTLQLAAVAHDSTADGRDTVLTGVVLTWTSSDTTVVRVSTVGLLTAVSWGTAVVRAAVRGVWGGTTVAVEEALNYAVVSAGGEHSCGLTTLGTAYCWGSWVFGDSAVRHGSSRPEAVPGGLRFTTVSAGWDHTCGLTAAGAAYCWGDNSLGELGDGTRTNTPATVPVAVSGGLTFAALSAGSRITCGVTTGGSAYCWGQLTSLGIHYERYLNMYPMPPPGCDLYISGSLPMEYGTAYCPRPMAVEGGLVLKTVSAGSGACGLTADGLAFCWGFSSTLAAAVSGDLTFAVVSAGYAHACGVTTAGAAYCWGWNAHGELGDLSTTNSLAPVSVAGEHRFLTISAGADHTCAVADDGAAYCWGTTAYGQLGNALATDASCGVLTSGSYCAGPMLVSGGLSFAAVSAGGMGFNTQDHTCGLTTDGAAYCWGFNYSGQLGNGLSQWSGCYLTQPAGAACSTTPTPVLPPLRR